MQIQKSPVLHLTYCQNIHPGESWAEHLSAIETKAVAVRDVLQPQSPFGIGLRLSAHAASELTNPHPRAEGASVFAQRNLYPFSINGFPFGKFHKGPVKENVYAPDWRTQERLQYTTQLADVLTQWLPEGLEGSISTVPGSFAPWIRSREDELLMAVNLGRMVAHLASLESQFGRRIHLGLEPEPDCFLETTPQTLAFFSDALPAGALPEIQRVHGVSKSQAEALLRRHIGVCFDTCHVALQYEDLSESLRALHAAGILISKIQLSAALRAPSGDATCQALAAFAEPTYLHQVKALTRSGHRISWTDLPQALDHLGSESDIEELRVHFHVPLFVAPKAPLESTASCLDKSFWRLVRSGICPHLEIETYTFDVLPPEVHPGDLIQSIASEYRWVLENLSGT